MAIFAVIFALVFASTDAGAAEFAVKQNVTLDKPSMFKSSVTIIAPEAQSASLWASTSAITPHFYVNTAGRVGIGTDSPVAPLHVVGISSFTGNIYMRNAKDIYMSSPSYIHLDGGAADQVLAKGSGSALKWRTVSAAPDGASLASTYIWVGNSSSLATAVAMSGHGSLSNTGALTLANSGVTADTYRSVTVDAKGRVTAGTKPTTFAGYGITAETSANLAAAISNETGSGALVFSAGPSFTDSVILNTSATLRYVTSVTPASAGAACTTGDIRWDANYVYVCTATNAWKRLALSSW